MIYPPINDLVAKTGNRYKLVIVTAKRAREIAQQERNAEKEKEKSSETITLESRMRDKITDKSKKKVIKPIIRALDEIIKGEVYIDYPTMIADEEIEDA